MLPELPGNHVLLTAGLCEEAPLSTIFSRLGSFRAGLPPALGLTSPMEQKTPFDFVLEGPRY